MLNSSYSNIVWLASYPRSGNTWFRVFLVNLLNDSKMPVDINKLDRIAVASNRNLFDRYSSVPSCGLSFEEADKLRPEVYERLAKNSNGLLFLKIHDAFIFLDNGQPLIPKNATKGAIYFVRNPLDLSVSFSHYSNQPIKRIIEFMANPTFSFGGNNIHAYYQLRQRLLSWSAHVQSWAENHAIPVHVMRYEDMKNKPFATFKGAVDFIELKKTDEQIKRAIKNSNIAELQRQEKQKGFRERPASVKSFFRKGQISTWREELTIEQVDLIIKNHKGVMRRFGYLDENDELVF